MPLQPFSAECSDEAYFRRNGILSICNQSWWKSTLFSRNIIPTAVYSTSMGRNTWRSPCELLSQLLGASNLRFIS
jgi:hypothetical protein